MSAGSDSDAQCMIRILEEAVICPLEHIPLWQWVETTIHSVFHGSCGLGFARQSRCQHVNACRSRGVDGDNVSKRNYIIPKDVPNNSDKVFNNSSGLFRRACDRVKNSVAAEDESCIKRTD